VLSDCPPGETLFVGPSAGDIDRLAGDGAGGGRAEPAAEGPETTDADELGGVLLLLLLLAVVATADPIDEVGTQDDDADVTVETIGLAAVDTVHGLLLFLALVEIVSELSECFPPSTLQQSVR